MNSDRTSIGQTTANKTDAGTGSKAICRVSNIHPSPSPDPGRSPNHNATLAMKLLIAILLLTVSCRGADTIISPDLKGPPVPDDLLVAYRAFIEDARSGDAAKIRIHLLPYAAEITPLDRAAPNREMGTDINVPFMKTSFSQLVLATSSLSDEAFSIRTGTTNIRWVRVAPNRWLIYGYLDKPIE